MFAFLGTFIAILTTAFLIYFASNSGMMDGKFTGT